jgi:hypothetical protein
MFRAAVLNWRAKEGTMLKWAVALAVPISVIMAVLASNRDASANPIATDELLGTFLIWHFLAWMALATFGIWLLGTLGLRVWRWLRST